MDGNSQEFLQAVETAKAFTSSPADTELLFLYGLYKQATIGDVNTTRPGKMDFKGKAKWDAWNERKGLPRWAAEKFYVSLVEELTPKFS